MDRRKFLATTLAAGSTLAATSTAGAAQGTEAIKIVGVSCSPRKGKTTAAALTVCLDAARAVSPAVTTELIELAGRGIGVFDPADPQATQGGFGNLIPVLSDASVAAIVVGTPVYFGNMTSLCKAFLDHCIVFRRQNFALGGKVAGVVAVGAARNGGQELTIRSVQSALLCQQMVVVGDGQPTGHFGATLINSNDDISADEFGTNTAKNLGRRVAEISLRACVKSDRFDVFRPMTRVWNGHHIRAI
jgi:multimeric flavodoxin WrbA